MGQDSKIPWCHHTFNPWWGCTKISAGCANCYAERHSNRFGTYWGPNAPRRFMSDEHWRQPAKWNRKAMEAGERHRVFCASMSDVFEEHHDSTINLSMNAERSRLWRLIEETPHLDWLLLTKRPENLDLVPLRWQTVSRPPKNVWVGVTAENQEQADMRIPLLLKAKWPAVRFVSYEPALGLVELQAPSLIDGDERGYLLPFKDTDAFLSRTPRIDWVIAGAESGPGARPMNEDWVRAIRAQCEDCETPFFYKQRIDNGQKIAMPELDGVVHSEFPR